MSNFVSSHLAVETSPLAAEEELESAMETAEELGLTIPRKIRANRFAMRTKVRNRLVKRPKLSKLPRSLEGV